MPEKTPPRKREKAHGTLVGFDELPQHLRAIAEARHDRELEMLAAFVHGALAALHLLGFAYNARRRQWIDASMHAGFVIYDARSTYLHARDARKV